jgi:ABC-type antimicrobial peptide transport system permease subunit
MVSFLWSYAIKDLGRNKTRSLMGIFGVAVSIFLLTTVSFLTDSISNAFVDYLTVDSGGQDMVLTTRSYYGQPQNRTSYFEYQDIIDEIQQNITEIEHYIPRAVFYSKTNGTANDPLNATSRFDLCAMDIKKEETVKIGKFTGINSSLNLANGLPVNSCMISPELAVGFNVSVGQQIEIYINTLGAYVNLTVLSTFEQLLKFPLYSESEIIVDISWWGETANQIAKGKSAKYNWTGRANYLVMYLKGAESIYDIRDVSGTEAFISEIGADILLQLGIEKWSMDYPKLEYLYISEFISMGMQVIFVMIALVSMLISGILINGILSTSVEEKIREYGINRVLGARKIYNLKLILIQASILCVVGTTLGILFASIAVKYAIIPYILTLIPEGYLTSTDLFVAQPLSIVYSYAIGIGVSMMVSVSPALKVMKMHIVESINPYRHDADLFKLENVNAGGNSKLIIFGSVLAMNGLFIYYVLPQMMLSMNIALIAGVLIGTLLLFLIGFSLLAIGLMPILIKLLCYLFEPFAKKVMNIIKITVYRHQRRNLSTIVMFVLSFSFIMFTTSIVEIQTKQVGALIQYNRGSDLQLVPKSYDIEAPTAKIQKQLMEIKGIERSSSLLASSYDLSQIYADENLDFEVALGDYINFKSNNIHLYGIDRNYKDTVYASEYVRFTEGSRDAAFKAVFNSSETNIIISTALSEALDLHVGDSSRLTFTKGTEQEAVVANIVGVASNMPGLNRFKEGQFQASNGGVIISNDNYFKYFNVPAGDNAYFDRIFIKVKEGYDHKKVMQEIYDKFEDEYEIYVRLTRDMVEDAEESFVIIKYVFLLILIGTVLIGLFGLITSAYSSILERKREIAIIRTLGLYGKEVDKMFLIESLILLLSSSTSGGLIGYLMASLLSETMTLFTETPRINAIPWDIVAIIYSVSVLFLVLGMRYLLRNLKKQNLIEIYRESM